MAIKCLWFTLILSAALGAQAQTITANSCEANDVQTAFNKITSSTKTVEIPAGTCRWKNQVTLTIPSTNTDLTVQGKTTTSVDCNSSGSCTGGASDSTVIVDDYASSNSLLIINTKSASSFFRLTGITIQGGSGSVKYQGFITVRGSENFRFDHNHLNSATYSPSEATAGMQIQGCTYGVADHNIIDQPTDSVNNGIQEYQGSCNGDSTGQGNGAWAEATALGTSKAFFVENNIFNNGFGNDCLYGGRFVFRYNTFHGTGTGAAIQTHATGSTTDGRGCRSWEFYHNTVIAHSGNYINDVFFLDSGTGVFWGNTIPSSSEGGGTGYKNVIGADDDRTNNDDHSHANCTSGTNCSNTWGHCGTAFSGIGSTWDQNLDTSTGYKCLDEPGTGQSDLLVGTFPHKCDQTSGQCSISNYKGTWPHQAHEPIYEWADAYKPVPDNQSDIWSTNYGPMTENRDYYHGTTDAGSPMSFDGTSGVGAGTVEPTNSSAYSNAPNCAPKVAYWDSSNHTLYQCTATNTWTAFYKPYTYPHPFTLGNPVPPLAPTNLKAAVN